MDVHPAPILFDGEFTTVGFSEVEEVLTAIGILYS